MATDELQRAFDALVNAVAAINFLVNDVTGTNDGAVGLGRDGSGNLTLFDSVTGSKTLASLAAGGGSAGVAKTVSGALSIPSGNLYFHKDIAIADGSTVAIGDGAELALL